MTTTSARPDEQIVSRACEMSKSRSMLRDWRLWLAIAAVALIAATSSSWSWLIAIGVAPLLLTLLPCAVMCVLGLCLMHKAGSDCKSSRQEKPDGASQARPIGPSS